MKARENAIPVLTSSNPWNDNSNPIWLTTTLKFYRNIDKFLFPGKLNIDKREQITSLAAQGLLESKHLPKSVLYRAENLSPLEKEILFEHFLSMRSFHRAQKGEAFILDPTCEFFGDHQPP